MEEKEGTHFYGDGCSTHGPQGDQGVIYIIQSDPKRLVTTTDIAERLEVKMTTVQRWVSRREKTGFPEDLGVRNAGGRRGNNGWLYDMREVEAWYGFWKLTRR